MVLQKKIIKENIFRWSSWTTICGFKSDFTNFKKTYCSTIGYEFMHMSDPDEKAWIRDRIEGPEKDITFTENGKRAILNKIIQAEGFEKYLHVKFVGTKRFGLDGGESLIPALEQIIKRGGNLGARNKNWNAS